MCLSISLRESALNELDHILEQGLGAVRAAATTAELSRIESEYLGSKGVLQAQMKLLGALPKEERPAFGSRLNVAKASMTDAMCERRSVLASQETDLQIQAEAIDVTLPGRPIAIGARHPLSSTIRQVKDVFLRLGFDIAEGPEIEEYRYNFEALNYPEDHPAFDEMMTFYLDDTRLLRTQTTAVQGRRLAVHNPPMKVATVGRCFRYEAVDATHHHTFHQVDAFLVAEGISMAHLKGTLKAFAEAMFGEAIRLRFRPDFFPFVEPGVDYSIFWNNRWLELGGAGLIHPNILEANGIDSEQYSGFAFGLGIERIHMVQTGVPDLRLYLENDMRFLGQFA